MIEHYDYQFNLSPHLKRIYKQESVDGKSTYLVGHVMTEYGTVGIYTQGDDKNFHHTRLDFPHGKTCYVRTFNKRYSERGIVTVAKKFAKEVLEGNQRGG